jgi:hypothetical protein
VLTRTPASAGRMRLIILACSATKRYDLGLLPALSRYDGPAFRTLRNALAAIAPAHRPDVLILSGKYGLITPTTPLPNYDHQMTTAQALGLRDQVRAALDQHLLTCRYDETFISLGAVYQTALPRDSLGVRLGQLCYASGGIGVRLGQLKRWLLDA